MPKKTSADPIEAVLAKSRPRKSPLWRGPEEDGVTFSLLSKFLVCRERFRLLVVEGLRAREKFPHRVEYGNMWHACEEGLSAQSAATARNYTGWEVKLRDYVRALMLRYPMDREAVQHWYNVCRIQFPEYLKYWAQHQDNAERVPLLQEKVFEVPYTLPSGRVVKLRGKWDSVDLIGKGKDAGIYLQENKTKGDIYEPQMRKQLTFDLQTMLYLAALTQDTGIDVLEDVKQRVGIGKMPHDRSRSAVKGVRYNVVRRPLSGGKGTIKRHEPTKKNPLGESAEDFYERLRTEYIVKDPAHYFMRWRVEVSQSEVARFRRECLDPVLEQLCDWWSWVKLSTVQKDGYGPFSSDDGCENSVDRPVNSYVHFRMPFGIYSPLLDGGATELDEYLDSGSMAGLARVSDLFSELSAVPT